MSGMRSCLTTFRNDVAASDYNVILLTETWLQKDHKDAEIFPKDWIVYRKNRTLKNESKDERGGGVIIAVHKSLASSAVDLTVDDRSTPFDFTYCKITAADKVIFFGCFYIKPNSPKEDYALLADQISLLHSTIAINDVIWIFGDANLPDVKWSPCEYNDYLFDPMNITTDAQYLFLTDILSKGIYQINNHKNNSNNVLDLIFTNVTDNFTLDAATLKLTNKSSIYHTILSINYFYSDINRVSTNTRTLVYDFDKADYAAINKDLDKLALSDESSDFLTEVNNFQINLMKIIELHTPRKIRTILTCPAHYDKSLRILRNKRNKAHLRYKRTKLPHHEHEFLALRDQFQKEEDIAITLHKYKIELKLLDEPKRFWNFVNDKRNSNTYPASMSYDGNTSSIPTEISNMFAKFFESVYVNPILFNEMHFSYIPDCLIESHQIYFTIEEVEMELDSLDITKSGGPDLIPPMLLKNTKKSISRFLLRLFNESLKYGIFPDTWKDSFLTPIFKSGDRAKISNYRGIAILSAIPKLFEKMVVGKLYMNIGDLINTHQHGFQKGKSTITNLADFTSYLQLNLSSGTQVDAIYTDFSKAFDKVDHKILLFKLRKLGVHGNLLTWIESYLSNRKQFVKFEGSLSDSILVTSGVPQGSHLGPLLFNIFINDITFLLKDCRFLLYADDLKIFRCVNNSEEMYILQENIDILSLWCTNNGMQLNIPKCSVITFSHRRQTTEYNYQINKVSLSRCNVIRDLGVMFDTKVTFKQHIDKISSSGHCILGFIKRRAKEFDDPYVTKSLYCALVKSVLEYASVIWAPYYNVDSNLIESVQKQFLLFALRGLGWDTYKLPPYKSRLLLLNMIPLASRRELASALFAFDLLRGKINCPSLCDKISVNKISRDLRHTRYLNEQYRGTNFLFNEPFNRAARSFNIFQDLYDNKITRHTFKVRILDRMKNIS